VSEMSVREHGIRCILVAVRSAKEGLPFRELLPAGRFDRCDYISWRKIVAQSSCVRKGADVHGNCLRCTASARSGGNLWLGWRCPVTEAYFGLVVTVLSLGAGGRDLEADYRRTCLYFLSYSTLNYTTTIQVL